MCMHVFHDKYYWSTVIHVLRIAWLCFLVESMESIKFKEIETRFLNLFNLPPEEKLVNCKLSL